MKVFVLTHYLDNGEEYPEDRMTWEEHYYFSSEEMLCASYSLDDYEDKEFGRWKAEAIELNTQKTEVLWKTEWKHCRSYEERYGKFTADPYEDYDFPQDYDYSENYDDEDSDDYANYLEEWGDANEWLIHNKSNLRALLEELEDKFSFLYPVDNEGFVMCPSIESLKLAHEIAKLQKALDMIHEDYPREL